MKKAKGKEQQGLRVPETTIVPLSGVNLAAYNPRVMAADAMRSLKASLVKHGMVLNLVVQRDGMVLIGGHQRVRAMRELCAEKGWEEPSELPAIILDVSDAQARQLNVALNNIDGEFDPYKLGEIFSPIRSEMSLDDVLATGFTPEQIDEMIKLNLPVEDQIQELEDDIANGMGGFASSITLSVEFDTTQRRDDTKAELATWAKERGVKPGVLLAEAVKAARSMGGRGSRAKAKSRKHADAE